MIEYKGKKQVVEFLDLGNGGCECQNLSNLYRIRDRASGAQQELESHSKKIKRLIFDDNLLIERYNYLHYEFEEKLEEYYGEVFALLQNPNNLELILHDSDSSKTKKITLLEHQQIKYSSPIVTINCAKCNQQIDVLAD